MNWKNRTGRYIRDPRLGHRFGINYKSRNINKNKQQYTFDLETDSYGYIHNGKEIDYLNKNKFRIIILGGSLSMGFGVSNNKKTIASCIEKIALTNDQKIEVINAGCGAYCSWQELIKLNLEIINLNPDLVINISGWNDMIHSSIGDKYSGDWQINHDRSIEDVAEMISFYEGKMKIKDYLNNKFNNISKSLKKIFNSNNNNMWSHNENQFIYRLEASKNYSQNCLSMYGACKENKIEYLLFLQPNPITIFKKYNFKNKYLSDDCKKFLNYYPESQKTYYNFINDSKINFKKNPQFLENNLYDYSSLEEFNETMWFDHCHLNEKGQEYIACKIYKNCINKLL